MVINIGILGGRIVWGLADIRGTNSMRVQQILDIKGTKVATVAPQASIATVATALVFGGDGKKGIGAVVVTSKSI